MAKCTEPGYEDERLWDWKVQATGSPESYPVQTQTISGWPWIYIYCFPGEIRLENGRVVKCPPHPFRRDGMRSWYTEDYGEYLPSAIQIMGAANLSLTITKVHSSHFRNGSHFFTLTQAEDEVRRLREQLILLKENTGFIVSNQRVDYKWMFIVTTTLLILVIVQKGYQLTVTLRKRAKIDRARETLERRRSAQTLSQQLNDVVANPTLRFPPETGRLSIMGSADRHRP